jgi:hypothetical protein
MGVLINYETKKGVKDYPELKKIIEDKLGKWKIWLNTGIIWMLKYYLKLFSINNLQNICLRRTLQLNFVINE